MQIAITGGGTGGHLSIAKALGQECKKQGIQTLYIGGTKGQDKQWFEHDTETFNTKIFLHSTPVVNQSFLGKFGALAQNITESFKAKKMMQELNVQACISVGGFSAATGSFGALFGKIPFFIHEQNACMGSLNKLLKPFAKIFFSSFDFPNTQITSYPINNAFFTKQRKREKLQYIAFLGGSQGAKAINEFALTMAQPLYEQNIKILHQAGKIDYNNTKQRYIDMGFSLAESLQDFQQNNKDIFVFDFSMQIPEIMEMADFCISRSGASSLWESVSNGLPTLFIPYPYAAKNHQYFNAKQLSDKNIALLYSQDEIQEFINGTKNPKDIVSHIIELNLSLISEKLLHETKPDGAQQIIQAVTKSLQ